VNIEYVDEMPAQADIGAEHTTSLAPGNTQIHGADLFELKPAQGHIPVNPSLMFPRFAEPSRDARKSA
jgi:hypothetical protein